MFPSKHMPDYMTEMNRLFQRSMENDTLQSPSMWSNTSSLPSPFNQSSVPNRSSSSADSTSPESFPDVSTLSSTPDFRLLSNTLDSPPSSISDTPFGGTCRPIIGRKILYNLDQGQTNSTPVKSPPIQKWDHEMEFAKSIWQAEEPITRTFAQSSPGQPNIFIEQKNYTQNVFYELFPAENKGFEFKTPIKQCPLSPNPGSSSTPTSPINPGPMSVARFDPKPISPKFCVVPSSSNSPQDGVSKVCTFCRKNGETQMVYMTHTVKERVGNNFIVTCPILRSHICPTCGATGDDAHTITYCPILRQKNHGHPLQSTTITLKNTRVKSNGRKRFYN